MLFTIPFYRFLFLTYFDLAEHHFLSDILVAFPDLSDLYTCGDSLRCPKDWHCKKQKESIYLKN